MGVLKLMRLYEDCTFTSPLSSEIAGRGIATDLSQWIYNHGRIYASDAMLGHNYIRVVETILHYANVCRKAGGTLVFCADNRSVASPAKSHEDARRRHLAAQAWAAWESNKSDLSLLKRAFKVTPDLQAAIIAGLLADGFDVLQSPLEADSQMASLFLEGRVFSVMSSDTDLLVYGITRLITRWNVHDDECTVVLPGFLKPNANGDLGNKLACFNEVDYRALMRVIASVSGNDYIKISGVGPGFARKVVHKLIEEKMKHRNNGTSDYIDAAKFATREVWTQCKGVAVVNGTPVTSETELCDRIRCAMSIYLLAPAFVFSKQQFLPMRVGPVSAEEETRIGVHYAILNAGSQGEISRRVLSSTVGDSAAVLSDRGIEYVPYPMRRSVPGARHEDINPDTATVAQCTSWLGHTSSTIAGTSSFTLPKLRETVRMLIHQERNTIGPEPLMHTGLHSAHARVALRGAPIAPLNFFARVRAKLAANDDGTFPHTAVPNFNGHAGSEPTHVREAKADLSSLASLYVMCVEYPAKTSPMSVEISRPDAHQYTFYSLNGRLDHGFLAENMPVLPMSVIMSYYTSHDRVVGCKPLVKGAAECADMESVPPHTIWAVSNQSGIRRSAWFSFTCHSSLGKSDRYRTEIEVEYMVPAVSADEVPSLAMLRPTIDKIVIALCRCRSGLAGMCWHVANGLFLLHNQLRIDGVGQSPTAILQRWNRPPGHALVLSTSSGAHRAAFLHAGAPRADGGGLGYTSMRTYMPAVSVGGRGAYGPPRELLPPRTEDIWTPTRKILLEAAAKAFGGRPAAAVWDDSLETMLQIRHASHDARVDAERENEAAMVAGGAPALAALKRTRASRAAEGNVRAVRKRRSRTRACSDLPHKPSRERPFFQRYPELHVLDTTAPYHAVRKLFLCKWCGWKTTSKHFAGGRCPKWEVGDGALLRLAAWQKGPTLRRTQLPAYVIPTAGQNFKTVNPQAQRKRPRLMEGQGLAAAE